MNRITNTGWFQLVIGILCMGLVANFQYGWTLFVLPLSDENGWSKAAIQVAFSIFIICQTWSAPFVGYLIDRFGPRPLVALGGLLAGGGWIIDFSATSLPTLYTGAAVSGLGVSIVAIASYGNVLKWFTKRRGLAVGLTAAGYGMGTALTVIPIGLLIQGAGYRDAFLYCGSIIGFAVVLCSLTLRTPETVDEETSDTAKQGCRPTETLRTPSFWILYAMFSMVAAGGLMATAQLGPIAHAFGVDKTPVTLLGITLPALLFALSIDRIMNGLTRPFFGFISDWIGREPTMAIAFFAEGLAIWGLAYYAQSPLLFIVFSALVFFAWGEIYSLFPALCADLFGKRFASTNYAMLYTAKGTASLLVPLSSIVAVTWGWKGIFVIAALLDITAACIALLFFVGRRKTQKA